jgi:hypothetical protein
MKNLILLLTIPAFALASCATSSVQKIGAINAQEKTIAVQQGGGELLASIKSALRSDGWRVVVVSGTKITPGDGLQFSGSRGYQARYSMIAEGYRYDTDLLTLKPLYRCNISVSDTKTGEEIMILDGEGTSKSITEKVMTALK